MSKILFSNKWIKLVEKEIKVGKESSKYYLVEKPDYVAIAPIFGSKILLIWQKRFGVGKVIKNIPMGIIEKKELPKDAAQRELLEETGIQVSKKELLSLGSFYIAPSFTAIKCYLYAVKCKNDFFCSSSDVDEKHEFVKMEWIDMKKIKLSDSIDMTTHLVIEKIKRIKG